MMLLLSVIRSSVPKLNLDDAFEQKNDIARAVEDELEKVISCYTFNIFPLVLNQIYQIILLLHVSQVQAMSHYGFEIVQTLIVDIEPDRRVKGAMNEINAGKYQS